MNVHLRDTHYIGGEWVAPHSAETIPVVSPASEEVIGHVPSGDAEDIDRALQAAQAALDSWSRCLPGRRADFLDALWRVLERRADELADLISEDVGMPRKMARRMQVDLPIEILKMYAGMARQFAFEEHVGNSVVLREPIGVVACITPWNYPLFQIATKLGPALAAGCTVVLKPSEVAPLAPFILVEAAEEARIPGGVVNLVSGYGQIVGEALVSHPCVDAISFTGSTRAGKRIGELAARDVKRVTLELGGKSAAVVLEDADLGKAVRATVNSCFLNSGQTCIALTRMLVPESRYEEAAVLAVEVARRIGLGDPQDSKAKLGPLVSAAQRDRVVAFIRRGIEEGADLIFGGPELPDEFVKGYYVKPTIFGRVSANSVIAQQEIFGPVLSIITYRDEDDAVEIANGTPYGLAAAVWSGRQDRAIRLARRMRVGQVEINGGPFNLSAPIGGFKQSGHGRELGTYGMEEFLEYKSLQLVADGPTEG